MRPRCEISLQSTLSCASLHLEVSKMSSTRRKTNVADRLYGELLNCTQCRLVAVPEIWIEPRLVENQ
jgi:hypothetical protein